MLISLRQFLRKRKILKPCPVKHYRPEDLDFIFNLYNNDKFAEPFQQGAALSDFIRDINTLHVNLQAHRSPTDEDNSPQANEVFYNLGALLQLQVPEVYDVADWKCLALDTLRFNCSEAINDLLAEYQYRDHIDNHRMYTHTPLLNVSGDPKVTLAPAMTKATKQFLKMHKLKTAMADDYFSMIGRYATMASEQTATAKDKG